MFYECAGQDATSIYEESEHPSWVDGQLAAYLIGELIEDKKETPIPSQEGASATKGS